MARNGNHVERLRKVGPTVEQQVLYLSQEQFREWVDKRSHLPLAVKGHTFVLKGDNVIVVDGGKFVYEEALQLVRLLNSGGPFAQISASLTILERNGALRLIVIGLIAVIAVVVILLATR